MEKILQQDEIDALFAAPRAATPPAVAKDGFEAFNFARAGQISIDQMRAIATVNDLFARNLRHTVGAWLRTEFHVALVSGEQMPYAEFIERIADSTYTSSIRLEPLGAVGLLELELSLASPIVDLLLGGTGKAQPVRALTDIEELIMASVAQMIVRELNSAWHAVGLTFNFDKQESSEQIARLMPPGERTLCVCFEIKMPEAQGVLNLCLPAVVLNTLLRRLITAQDRPRNRPVEMRNRLRELAGTAKVAAVLQFPPVRVHSREIANLQVGSVLRLSVPRHAAAELRIAGLSLARARPVRMGEHRGARLEPFTNEAELHETIH